MSAHVSTVCSACDEDCQATFVCSSCHRTMQVCTCKPGGFTSPTTDLCVTCYEEEQIPPAILHVIRRREYDQKNYARKHRSKQ